MCSYSSTTAKCLLGTGIKYTLQDNEELIGVFGEYASAYGGPENFFYSLGFTARVNESSSSNSSWLILNKKPSVVPHICSDLLVKA